MSRAVVVIIVAVLLAVPLAWIGGEMHYRNCVDAAKAVHPARTTSDGFSSGGPDEPGDVISKCSRWPF